MLRALLCHPPPHRPAQRYDACVIVHATVRARTVCVCVCVLGGKHVVVVVLFCSGGSYIYWALEAVFDTPQNIQQEVESRICVYICLCVSAQSETTRLLNTNTDISVDSVSG